MVSLFANFYINTYERYLRLIDSYNSIKELNFNSYVINVRGKYQSEVIQFLSEQNEKIQITCYQSKKGWFYDSSLLFRNLNGKFVFNWIEDHLCMNPSLFNDVVNEMEIYDIDILTYSFWCNSEMRKRYEMFDHKSCKNFSYFLHTEIINNLMKEKYKHSTYIISYASVLKKSLFKKIILDNGSCKKWPKHTPFDFEKDSNRIDWLPLLRGVPYEELFASIDDDLNSNGSSLIGRGLYPAREKRKTYANRSTYKILCTKLKKFLK